MATALRGRPAHAPGATYLAWSPNGTTLITVGANTAFRVFQHNSDSEPRVIDVLTEAHTAVVATNDSIIVGSEDGSVSKYSLKDFGLEDILTRCAAPIRDLALSSDGRWAAVASDETEVKIVNTDNMSQVRYLREHPRSVKHVSFDQDGKTLAVSCSDGVIYLYALSSDEPRLVKKIDGIIRRLEGDSESSSKVQWHPDGRAISAPTPAKAYSVLSSGDWKQRTAFDGHTDDITAAAWSPNGALLATAGMDHKLIIWDSRSQRVLTQFDDLRHNVLSMQWHPTDNLLAYTNAHGELFMRSEVVPREHSKLLRVALESAPLAQPLREISGNTSRRAPISKHDVQATTEDYDDQFFGLDDASDAGAGFIVDDDGAGYAEEPNHFGKRSAVPLPRSAKRHAVEAWQPDIHEAFQTGATPWKGNRRYLCLNLTGFVWTVNQETHHTVTVEFYDRNEHRDFHFTDPYLYDKACLNDNGTLFSCPMRSGQPAMLYYRPHQTWTARTEWRFPMPAGEEATSISLSESCIVATTSAGYVRIFSLFGVPLRVYRQKSIPAVTCASWRDYVMTLGNGPVGADGVTRLCYTIENVKRDETYQNEDTLPLPEDADLRAVFFSDKGDPCIYDSDGVLLILQHWRTPGQARWVPLLDTRQLERLAGGRKDETYWPVAVANDRFHCIILKGGETYPYFPRPLLSDFDFSIPIGLSSVEDEDLAAQRVLEEQFVRKSLQHSLHADMVENTNATSAQRAELPVLEREVDKVLLQMLGSECRDGEERGMKALEISQLMRDRSGNMLEAAVKIANRFQRDVLAEKITLLAERRLVGLVDEDDL